MDRYAALIVLVCAHVASCDNPVLDFEVSEELAHSYVGSVASTGHLRSLYTDDVIASFGFGFAPHANQDDSLFEIERETGIIRTSASGIDREEHCPAMDACFLYINVAVVQPIELFQVMTARISVLDTNDNSPHFPHPSLDLSFSESALPSAFRILPQAVDLDSPDFGIVAYELSPPSDQFWLRSPEQEEDGNLKLYVAANLDREARDSYEFTVVARDGGSAALSGTLAVHVTVEDYNDNAPTFTSSHYSTALREDQSPGQLVLTVSAHDPDHGLNGQVSYSLSPTSEARYGELFTIDSVSGDLLLKSRLDYETEREHVLEVIARDAGADSKQVQTKVTVQVKDVNDFTPMVTINALAGTNVMENLDPGIFVAYMSVFDADSRDNGKTSCSLDNPAFALQALSGENQYKIITDTTFDREVVDRYDLTITCHDLGQPVLQGAQNLTVLVADVNDNPPEFTQAEYVVSLAENNMPGHVITAVHASDPDLYDNGRVTYSMANGAVSQFVAVDENSGEIRAKQRLDYELVKTLTFQVLASDHGSPNFTVQAVVTITLLDTNDQAPIFSEQTYTFQVYENEADVTHVGDVLAEDQDSAQWNDFRYDLQVAPQWDVFEIDPSSGVITTKSSLDREHVDYYSFHVIARDVFDPSLVSTATVIVRVLDKNDNSPVITFPSVNNESIAVPPQLATGQVVTQISARDEDILDNALLVYTLTHHNENDVLEMFEIDAISGTVTTKAPLSDKDGEIYVLLISVQDQGSPRRRTHGELVIVVDSSAPYRRRQPPSDELVEQNNVQAIIGVSTASAVIVLALVLIILVIKLRDGRLCHKGKALMPHYQIEQKNNTSYDGICNSADVFTVDTHNDMQIAPYTESPQHSAMASDHGILYDKRLDKHNPDRPQINVLTLGPCGNAEVDLSSSTETSDSGRGGSVDGEAHSMRQENGKHIPDILQSRSPMTGQRAALPCSRQHCQSAEPARPAPPSYNSFLRQKSQRGSGPAVHSSSCRDYRAFEAPVPHTPVPHTPVLASRSQPHNSHNSSHNISHNSSHNTSYTHTSQKDRGMDCSGVHSGTSFVPRAKSCQADSYHIARETQSRAPSPAKRVNFTCHSSSSKHCDTKLTLQGVSNSVFNSVTV